MKILMRLDAYILRDSRELPDEIMTMGLELKDRINIPKWSEWQVYPKEEFTESYQWMVERDMVDYGYNYENLVDLRAFDGD